MSITNCSVCGKVLINVRGDYCEPCGERMMEYRRAIREFLRYNSKSTMWDVHTKLSIPLSIVQLLTKEDFPLDEGGPKK